MAFVHLSCQLLEGQTYDTGLFQVQNVQRKYSLNLFELRKYLPPLTFLCTPSHLLVPSLRVITPWPQILRNGARTLSSTHMRHACPDPEPILGQLMETAVPVLFVE